MAANLREVMTREEAISDFKAMILPSIQADELSRGLDTVYNIDEVQRSEAWNNYTDSLRAEHRISDWQYDNWSHPDCCNS
tara:strand:- start:160 stop:399 length:240 start_codon:yes stop_codon:yes gene_type:complete